ncbi:hypothetical protein KI387_008538, partial [Taxus chinensis]
MYNNVEEGAFDELRAITQNTLGGLKAIKDALDGMKAITQNTLGGLKVIEDALDGMKAIIEEIFDGMKFISEEVQVVCFESHHTKCTGGLKATKDAPNGMKVIIEDALDGMKAITEEVQCGNAGPEKLKNPQLKLDQCSGTMQRDRQVNPLHSLFCPSQKRSKPSGSESLGLLDFIRCVIQVLLESE